MLFRSFKDTTNESRSSGQRRENSFVTLFARLEPFGEKGLLGFYFSQFQCFLEMFGRSLGAI
jgi:hypothetical protein